MRDRRAQVKKPAPSRNSEGVSGRSAGTIAKSAASSAQPAADPEVRTERARRVGHRVEQLSVGAAVKSQQDPKAPGRGAPLPDSLHSKMSQAFGHDFSSVRIHEGAQAKTLGAIAYTRGEEIHFAPGKYSPRSREGQELLGHELAHVVQQRAGRVALPRGKGPPINADPGHESEAEEMGKRAASNLKATAVGSGSRDGGQGTRGGAIQRAGDPSLSNLTRPQRARVLRNRNRRRKKQAQASVKPRKKRRNRNRNRNRNPPAQPPVVVNPPAQPPAVANPPPQPPAVANLPAQPPAPVNANPPAPAPVNDAAAKTAWDESYEASAPNLPGTLETLGESAAGAFDSTPEIMEAGKGNYGKGLGRLTGAGIHNLDGDRETYWRDKFHPKDEESEHSQVGDIGSGFADILAGGASLPEQGKRLFGKETGAVDRVSSGAKFAKGLGKITSGGLKAARGFGASGGGLKNAMADTGAVTGSLNLIGQTADAVKSAQGFQEDKRRGKFEAQGGKESQSRLSALSRSRLRGGAKAAGLLGAGAGAVKGIAGAVGSGAAPAVGAVAGAVGGGLGAVIGAGQMISGGHRLWLGHKRKKALSGVQAQGGTDKAEALEHLKQIQSKRQKKAGIDMAFGAGGIVSGALIASGVAAPVGIGLAAGLGALKLGHMAFKGIRQWGRNKAAKAAQGSRWRKIFNADKSTDKKKAKDLKTAKTVLGMEDGAHRQAMLTSLGLSHGNAFKKYDKATKTRVDMTEEEKLTEITKKLRKR